MSNPSAHTSTASHTMITLPQIGTRLSVESAHLSGRFWSRLIGYCKGSYVILEMPEAKIPPGLNTPFTEQDVLTIRYVEDGTVVAFRTPVIGRIRSPAMLTVTAYPHHVHTHTLRQHPRLSCYLPCHGRIGEYAFARALLRDISVHGCQLRVPTEHLPQEGEQTVVESDIEIELMLPGEHGENPLHQRVNGRVVGFEAESGYAMLRVHTDADLNELMNYLSAFTARIEFTATA